MKPILLCGLTLVALAFGPGPAAADDLDIYGGQTISVPPNVLIIFDNSSSMMCCLTDACAAPSNCATLANQRMYVAKNAIKSLVDRVDGVNFGLMVFNSNAEGGRVIQPLVLNTSANKTAIKNAIDAITTTRPATSGGASAASSLVAGSYTYTPLAETLAEAGLYFKGSNTTSWFNSGTTYTTSPINQPCQKNYIILMTDGAPTEDRSTLLSSGNSGRVYVDGVHKIGNYDQDERDGNGVINDNDETSGYASNGSDYLDDVAKYLYDNDCRPGYGSGDFVKQNIRTYTIGFTTTNTLLNDTAVHGGTTRVHNADNTTDLDQAFNEILNVIQDSNGTYVAPTIPRNPDNQSDVGDKVYMALFKPQQSGRWIGNLKAFGLANGVLMDASATPVQATDANGSILDTAKSYWSAAADGVKVDYGGAGALLAARPLSGTGSRSVYTFTATAQTALTHASNKFTDASNNPQLTAAMLGAATNAARDAIVAQTLAGVTVTHSDGTTVANWRLGDIVHSEPLVKNFEATYQNGVIDAGETIKSYIFVGANDGMLHVFNAADGGEAWAFVPPGQHSRLSLLTSDTSHDYFVDGSPLIEAVKKADNTTMQLLVFGERRGGRRYYALDVTNPDQPVWTYQITDSLLANLDWDGSGAVEGAAATLGLAWSKPQFKKVRSGNLIKEVFLLAGGYDTNQDLATPANSDAVGRALYAVQAETGAVFGLNINAGNWQDGSNNPYMTHAIVDVTGFDRGGYGYLDRIYAGDLGGKVFAARYNSCTDSSCTNDTWEKFVLMNLPTTVTVGGTPYTLGRKFMARPEASIETDGECVYLGTGDREHPGETASLNAFYAICNKWQKDGGGVLQPLTLGNLVDVTTNLVQQGTDDEKAQVKEALKNGYGWYIRLPNSGEKMVSSPKLLNQKLYFTTFTPGSTVSADPCTVSFDYGVSRLYVVDYRTGSATYNFNADGSMTKEDRSKIIGTSMPGELVLTSSGAETSLFYGSGGKFEGMPVETSPLLKRYFWRQLK